MADKELKKIKKKRASADASYTMRGIGAAAGRVG